MVEEVFRLAGDGARVAAEALFQRVAASLRGVLPATAEVMHVGATAVPGCLTKGDLDVVVRVERADFGAVEAVLAGRFRRNAGSVRTAEFAAFEDSEVEPHLGVQLVVKGAGLDVFHRFAAALAADPGLVRRYNTLKRTYDGGPMARYRAAKDRFVGEVLEEVARTARGASSL